MDSNQKEMTKGNSPQVQRRLKRSDGVYVEGAIEGFKMTFTADTGATRSIISRRVFDKISLENRPQLRKSVGLLSVSGTPLKEYGCAY
ncbi:MAG: aspartyl protease family protein, partial [Candidatus Thiodiazotropha sp.]